MDPMRLASLTDEIMVASAPSIGKFIQRAVAEEIYKQAWMDNWPELFGTWDKARRRSATLGEVDKMIGDRVLFHGGNSVPNGIYTVATAPSQAGSSDRPIIPFPAYAGSTLLPRGSGDPIKRAASSACPIIASE